MNKALQAMNDALPSATEEALAVVQRERDYEELVNQCYRLLCRTFHAFQGLHGLYYKSDKTPVAGHWFLSVKDIDPRNEDIVASARIERDYAKRWVRIIWYPGLLPYRGAGEVNDTNTKGEFIRSSMEDFEEAFGKAMAKKIVEIQVANGTIFA